MFFSLLTALAAASATPACSLIYPVAPDERAARRIAESAIAARPHPMPPGYILRVMVDQDDPGQWSAFQVLPEPRFRRPLRPGEVIVSSGGGGLGMRIDRCTGAVSRLFYSR